MIYEVDDLDITDENNNSTKKEGYIKIPNNIARCKAYCKWSKTAAATTYLYLQSWIIRGKVKKVCGVDLLKDYFRKGHLVARWSQKSIAKHFDIGQSAVSKHMTSLTEAGFIKIIKYKIPHRREYFNIYDFGTHDFAGNESTYLMQHFGLLALEEELARESARSELSEDDKYNNDIP